MPVRDSIPYVEARWCYTIVEVLYHSATLMGRILLRQPAWRWPPHSNPMDIDHRSSISGASAGTPNFLSTCSLSSARTPVGLGLERLWACSRCRRSCMTSGCGDSDGEKKNRVPHCGRIRSPHGRLCCLGAWIQKGEWASCGWTLGLGMD